MKWDTGFSKKGSKMKCVAREPLLSLECQSWRPQLHLHIPPLKPCEEWCQNDFQGLLENEL